MALFCNLFIERPLNVMWNMLLYAAETWTVTQADTEIVSHENVDLEEDGNNQVDEISRNISYIEADS